VLLVVDANVLVSELLRKRGRELIESPTLSLRLSEEVLDATLHSLRNRAAKIVERRRASREAADKMLEDAAGALERGTVPVPREVFAALEERAAHRIPRDPDDVPTVALALGGDEGRCGI
jgi:predicted nucleic acid-binding protein